MRQERKEQQRDAAADPEEPPEEETEDPELEQEVADGKSREGDDAGAGHGEQQPKGHRAGKPAADPCCPVRGGVDVQAPAASARWLSTITWQHDSHASYLRTQLPGAQQAAPEAAVESGKPRGRRGKKPGDSSAAAAAEFRVPVLLVVDCRQANKHGQPLLEVAGAEIRGTAGVDDITKALVSAFNMHG